MKLWVVPIAIINLIGCAQIPNHSKNPEVLMSDILEDPWEYHGKNIIVRGTFNECASLTCRICESDVPVDAYKDENVCMGTSFKERHLEAQARYSTSVVSANYDATCSGIQKDPKSHEIILCTDRATQLTQSSIIDVVTRRAPSEGFISSYGTSPLLKPDARTADELISAFIDQLHPTTKFTREEIEHPFLFDLTNHQKGIESEGGVCYCKNGIGKCDSVAPTLEGHIYFLPYENPYQCWIAVKTNGSWRYPVPQ